MFFLKSRLLLTIPCAIINDNLYKEIPWGAITRVFVSIFRKANVTEDRRRVEHQRETTTDHKRHHRLSKCQSRA